MSKIETVILIDPKAFVIMFEAMNEPMKHIGRDQFNTLSETFDTEVIGKCLD